MEGKALADQTVLQQLLTTTLDETYVKSWMEHTSEAQLEGPIASMYVPCIKSARTHF